MSRTYPLLHNAFTFIQIKLFKKENHLYNILNFTSLLKKIPSPNPNVSVFNDSVISRHRAHVRTWANFVPVCALIHTEHRLRTENGPNKTHADNLGDGKVRGSHK